MTAERPNMLPWVLAAMLAATLPMWFVTTPPLIDFVGHMGRYHIQLNLDRSPALQAHWDYDWRLIGNLGVDLLMEPLGRLLGVEGASWLVAALLPPLMIWGVVRLARAWHGAIPPTIVAAFPFALAYPWQYGLVNYWLAAALAFHAAASVVLRPRSAGSAVGLALLSIGLWVCHIYGWAIFAILVAAQAMTTAGREDRWRRILALWPLALPVLLMIALSYGRHEAAGSLGWFAFGHKWMALLYTLRDQNRLLDLLSLLAALSIVVVPLRKHMQFAPTGLIAAALLFAATMILPYQFLGSAWADARLWPIVFIALIASVRPRDGAPGFVRTWLPAALLALFAVRLVVGAIGFAGYDRAYKSHLAALDRIQPGARVATFVRFPCHVSWRRPRLEHLDGMAIVRRDAFTNGQWDVPGAQLVTPLAARGTRFNADPSELVGLNRCEDDLRPALGDAIARLPRDRFDYVWVLDFAPASLPVYPGLRPVFADDRSILYRIARP